MIVRYPSSSAIALDSCVIPQMLRTRRHCKLGIFGVHSESCGVLTNCKEWQLLFV